MNGLYPWKYQQFQISLIGNDFNTSYYLRVVEVSYTEESHACVEHVLKLIFYLFPKGWDNEQAMR